MFSAQAKPTQRKSGPRPLTCPYCHRIDCNHCVCAGWPGCKHKPGEMCSRSRYRRRRVCNPCEKAKLAEKKRCKELGIPFINKSRRLRGAAEPISAAAASSDKWESPEKIAKWRGSVRRMGGRRTSSNESERARLVLGLGFQLDADSDLEESSVGKGTEMATPGRVSRERSDSYEFALQAKGRVSPVVPCGSELQLQVSRDAVDDALGWDAGMEGIVVPISASLSTPSTLSSSVSDPAFFGVDNIVPAHPPLPPLIDSPENHGVERRRHRISSASSIDVSEAIGMIDESATLSVGDGDNSVCDGSTDTISFFDGVLEDSENKSICVNDGRNTSFGKLPLSSSKNQSLEYTRESILHIHVSGNKTPFGIIRVNQERDKLDYVRRYITKRFWRELSGREWGFLSQQGTRIVRSQERDTNAWYQGFVQYLGSPKSRRVMTDFGKERRHIFVFVGAVISQVSPIDSKKRARDSDTSSDDQDENDEEKYKKDDRKKGFSQKGTVENDENSSMQPLAKRFRCADADVRGRIMCRFLETHFGCDTSSLMKNKTPTTLLIIAASNGLAYFGRRLLVMGADPNVQDSEGNTPLHIGARCGHADFVRVLLETSCPLSASAGPCGSVDVSMKNAKGQSAIEVAKTFEMKALIAMQFHKRKVNVSELVDEACRAADKIEKERKNEVELNRPDMNHLLGLRLLNLRALVLSTIADPAGGWGGAAFSFMCGNVHIRPEQEVDFTLQEIVDGCGEFSIVVSGAAPNDEKAFAYAEAAAAIAAEGEEKEDDGNFEEETVAEKYAVPVSSATVSSEARDISSSMKKLNIKEKEGLMKMVPSPPPRAPRLSLAASMEVIPKRRVHIALAATATPSSPKSVESENVKSER